jgi:hypothetical protein
MDRVRKHYVTVTVADASQVGTTTNFTSFAEPTSTSTTPWLVRIPFPAFTNSLGEEYVDDGAKMKVRVISARSVYRLNNLIFNYPTAAFNPERLTYYANAPTAYYLEAGNWNKNQWFMDQFAADPGPMFQASWAGIALRSTDSMGLSTAFNCPAMLVGNSFAELTDVNGNMLIKSAPSQANTRPRFWCSIGSMGKSFGLWASHSANLGRANVRDEGYNVYKPMVVRFTGTNSNGAFVPAVLGSSPSFGVTDGYFGLASEQQLMCMTSDQHSANREYVPQNTIYPREDMLILKPRRTEQFVEFKALILDPLRRHDHNDLFDCFVELDLEFTCSPP